MATEKNQFVLLITCLAYTSFVIYGSLVPLEFVYLPLEEAFNKFQNIRYLKLGIGSRADWVANIILFIPLTFLWMAFFHQRATDFRYFVAFLIIIVATTLSISIEFTQLYFPQRTVSRNDIIAEVIGGITGIAIWRMYGQQFKIWFTRWNTDREKSGRYEQILYVYLAILFIYNLLPLDLTNSPVEIYHKWVDGKVHIVPFFASFENGLVSFLYGIFVDIIIWAPVPFLWVLSAKKTLLQAFKWAWFSALLLEFLQLFVYSRVSDSADLITAALGAGLGIYIANKYRPSSKIAISPQRTNKASWLPINSLLLVTGWSTVLFLVFWFPYDFQLNPKFIKERIPDLYKAPFSAYYYGTEFRAITSLLSKLAFFFPLGVLLAHLKTGLPRSWPNSLLIIAMAIFLISIASTIELGQITLPDKSIDSADILVAIIGGLLGYFAYQFVTGGHDNIKTSPIPGTQKTTSEWKEPSKQQPSPILDRVSHNQKTTPQHTLLSSWWLLPLQGVIVVLVSYLIEGVSSAPYNVKELVASSNLFERIIFCLALFTAVWPLLFSTRAYCTHKLEGKQFSAIVVIQPFILYGLLRLSVPLESIHDIVGYPVISTAWGLESLLRFVALYSLLSWALIGGTILLFYPVPNRLLTWLLMGIIVIITWHWVVVRSAATDNLTELFRDNGNWQSTLWLTGWFVCFSTALLTGLKLASGNSKYWLIALFVVAASFPISYWILNQALEIVILKYDQVFSGLQFLLSPDREHLVAEKDLMQRYFLAYFALLSGLGWLGITATTCKPSNFNTKTTRLHAANKRTASKRTIQ